MIISKLSKWGNATRKTESVNHDHEQCCYVPGTARSTWTLGLGTEGGVSR